MIEEGYLLTNVSTSVDTSPGLSTVSVPDTLDVSSLWAHGFPSADLVGAAASLLTPRRRTGVPFTRSEVVGGVRVTTAEARRTWTTDEGPVARLVVAPGAVQVARTDPAKRERTSERARRTARIAATLGASELLLEDRLADSDDLLRASLVIGDSAAADSAGAWSDWLAGRIRRRDEDRTPEPGRTITAWSSKSRANMVRVLAQLDYAPLFATAGTPAMVTLTYPGEWRSVAPSASVCKGHMDALRKRFQRFYGVPLVCIWKREFQRRGAPHYHLLMTPPAPVTVKGRRWTFQQWLADAWVSIVGHPDPLERAAMLRVHLGPGVVDFGEGMRARDPKRLAVYFSKHGSFAAKDYQNDAPGEWLGEVVPFAHQGSVGRFWGHWGLDKALAVVEVSDVEATAAARTLRRWQRANGFRVQREVWRNRYDTATGEAKRPRRRRSGVWVGARMRSGSAGFAVVNDGPAMLSTLARYLDVVREDAYDTEVAAWLSDPARLREVDGYRWPSEVTPRYPVRVWADKDPLTGDPLPIEPDPLTLL